MTNDRPNFATTITQFTRRLESLGSALPRVMGLMTAVRSKAKGDLGDYLDKYTIVKEQKNTTTTYTVPSEHISAVRKRQRDEERAREGFRLLHQTFVVSLVSQFDSYLGNLVRIFYRAHPEALNSSEKQLSFEKLTEFNSIDAAREFVLESEVESVIRESHATHFDWLERKLGIRCAKDYRLGRNLLN